MTTAGFPDIMPQAAQIRPLRVLGVRDDDTVLAAPADDQSVKVVCDVLRTSEGPPLRLAPGDTVLVYRAGDTGTNGVVLGRVGPTAAPDDQPGEPPDELVIDARESLTLKCGEGSVTMRKDGKVLIKGKHVLSRASGTNRIKGGSVAVN